ncbi:hypothetical protein NCC49_003773 [Naganishia albida]|nr:hypothetical protein NCC49_003773 [Naganishia albida]
MNTTAEPQPKTTYVHHTTKKGNMSLVKPEIYGKFEKARLSRPVKPPTKSGKLTHTGYPGKRPYSQSFNATGGSNLVLGGKRGHSGKKTYTSQLSCANGGTSVAKRVVIDGATYEFAEDGNLKRVEDAPSVKQKKRKLDNREGSQTRKKAKRSIETHCRFFTKTGTCLRADRCPYIHDPHRIAICSRFLRNKCPLTAETCPVSHKPSPHNTPSCAHFQKNGFCRDDDACLYPHVKVADNAPVCVAFSTEGWCDKGADCQERHAWECREYSEKGVCSRGAKCGLAHILKAKSVQPPSEGNANDSTAKSSRGIQQPDDVEPPIPGIPLVPEKTIEAEQHVAQNQALHAADQAAPSANDFERQEDFIQFADLDDVDQDEDDEEDEDDSSDGDEEESGKSDEEEIGKSDEGDVADDRIKYSFGDGSDGASADDGNADDDDGVVEELMVVD